MLDDNMVSYKLLSKTPDSDGYDSNPSGYICSRDNYILETCIS